MIKRPACIILFALFILSFICPFTSAKEILTAPNHTISLKSEEFYIKGWACGKEGSTAYSMTVDYLIRLKNIEQAFLLCKDKLEKQYTELKSTIKPPARFEGLSKKTIQNIIDLALKDYPKKLLNYHLDLDKIKNELKDIKAGPEKIFDISFDEKRLYPSSTGDLYLATWEDDGQYRVYMLTDCYTKEEVKAMQSVIEKILDNALTARDELLKAINRMYDGKEGAIPELKYIF